MRKHTVIAGISAVALIGTLTFTGQAAGQVGDDGGKPFQLRMSGANEFNPQGAAINPHGDLDNGTVRLTLNQGQQRVCWTFGALTMTQGEPLPTVAHIHKAPAGVAGSVVVPLFGSAAYPAPNAYPTGTTCVPASKALVKDMRQNPKSYYINLHNAPHTGGVMRAQLG